MKTLRAGVSRLREELAALLGADVGEVAGPRGPGGRAPVPGTPVLIGTEAVLHRVRRAAAVAFLDIDLHLLAPRLSATEETLALFVRAARLVGARGTGAPWARMLAQTRVPDHPVLQAVAPGDPTAVLAEEADDPPRLGLPPFSALAVVSGALAPAYAEALRREAAGGRRRRCRLGVAARRRRFLLRARHSRAALRPAGPQCPGRPGAGCAWRSTRPRSERWTGRRTPARIGNRPERR